MSSQGISCRKNVMSVLQEADRLLETYQFEKVYDLLHPFKDIDDVELLWRLTKSAYEVSRTCHDKKRAKHLDVDGYHWIQRAMKLDDKHPEVHKMMAVMLDSYHKHQGIKARIAKTTEVKAHMIKASELNPADPHPFYMLGWWYFTVADMPWAHIQIARIIFSSPMSASFEDALSCFEKSLERDKEHSRFFLMNLVMLSKTHLKLGNTEEALKYLKQVGEYQVQSPVDQEACTEAATLLTQLGFTTTDLKSCDNDVAS